MESMVSSFPHSKVNASHDPLMIFVLASILCCIKGTNSDKSVTTLFALFKKKEKQAKILKVKHTLNPNPNFIHNITDTFETEKRKFTWTVLYSGNGNHFSVSYMN